MEYFFQRENILIFLLNFLKKNQKAKYISVGGFSGVKFALNNQFLQFLDIIKNDFVIEKIRFNNLQLGSDLLPHLSYLLNNNNSLRCIELEGNNLKDYERWKEFVASLAERITPVKITIPTSDLHQMRKNISDVKFQTLLKDLHQLSKRSQEHENNITNPTFTQLFSPRSTFTSVKPTSRFQNDSEWISQFQKIPPINKCNLLTKLQNTFRLTTLLEQIT